MTELYHILKKKYEKMVYVVEENNTAHLCISVKNIDLKILKKNYYIFTEYIQSACLVAMDISKKYNKATFITHMDLKDSSMKNVSLKLFKKVNKKLSENLKDVLDKFYIYGRGTFLKTMVGIIKSQLDPITKKKIVLISDNISSRAVSTFSSSSF